jgi:hypothetical protein
MGELERLTRKVEKTIPAMNIHIVQRSDARVPEKFTRGR